MFFASVNVGSTRESATFDLKHDLRDMLYDFFNDDHLLHAIMGYVQGGERIGAKIMMSYPYNNGIIRMWGWIPLIAQSKYSYDDILDEIYYEFLLPTYGMNQKPLWYYFNSGEDSDVLNYIKTYLLIGGE